MGMNCCCMAFADDLVLITEDMSHMQMTIKESKEFFYGKSLEANVRKYAKLCVVPAPKKKSIK